MKTTRRVQNRKTTLLALLGAASLVVGAAISPLQAQDTQNKVDLMSAALKAKNEGNLAEAKRNLEAVLAIAPDDANTQRLLADVNAQLGGGGASTAPVGLPPSPVAAAEPATAQPVDINAILNAAAASDAEAAKAARASAKSARKALKAGNLDEAEATIADALASTEGNPSAVRVREQLTNLQLDLLLARSAAALEAKDIEGATSFADAYVAAAGSDRQSEAAYAAVEDFLRDPNNRDINLISADFVQRRQELNEQITIGIAQYQNGDFDGALETFQKVDARDPSNTEAKFYIARISAIKRQRGELNREQTREIFLQAVNEAWSLPRIFDRDVDPTPTKIVDPVGEKLKAITIPEVNFRNLPLTRVIETLHAFSVQHNVPVEGDNNVAGVNIVLVDPQQADPTVNITLRNLSLKRILDFVVQQHSYEYDIKEDSVVVRPGGTDAGLETQFFPISTGTIIRITNRPEGAGGGGASDLSPFDDPEPLDLGGGSDGGSDEELVKNFFERAGVSFTQVPGAKLALTDAQLIVTQTSRNLRKIEDILKRFSEVKQVEIESKFLEVQQGDLEEFGVNWNIAGGGYVFASQNRSLFTAFQTRTQQRDLIITSLDLFGMAAINIVPSPPPEIPGELDLGPEELRTINFTGDPADDINLGPGTLATYGGVIGNYDVQAIISALSRKKGNDLMSAPKVTVLSKKTAEIVVAQELLYPESYGDIESEVSQVGGGGGIGGGAAAAAVTITAGTPQDFTVRNVGVEMEVTPTVEEDRSISLLLEPRVTEFEGFVEYGGPSVAISGGTTVTVPAGFFQPIFSVRRVRTEVTIWDGATVLLGGLTREQILSVSDKVPVLGNIPLIGKLFQSRGESSQKRNLLVFVTANLISPGGAPAYEDFRTANRNSTYQNAVVVTPGGIETRSSELVKQAAGTAE